jgi:hypothetical protein
VLLRAGLVAGFVNYANRLLHLTRFHSKPPCKRYQNKWRGSLFSETIVIMGPISSALDRLLDKLPRWAQRILMVFVAVGSVYYIAHHGFHFSAEADLQSPP